jgi:predicted short-subunit dehydrogenase-like oxidoreductase (DUF2520 family)
VTVAVLGYGQLGRALAGALAGAGHAVTVWTRSDVGTRDRATGVGFLAGSDLEPAVRAADVVWVAVADRAVGEVARRLAGVSRTWSGASVIHSSGALPAHALDPVAERGAEIAVCHPLRAFAPAAGREGSASAGRNPFAGAPFTLEGSPAGVETARRLVVELGGVPLESRVRDRALYHLAAVVASNYGLLVRDWSARRFRSAGLSDSDASRAADALLANALERARAAPGEAATTGPVRRGDLETVRAHLSRLEGNERLAYAALGLLLLDSVRREPGAGPAELHPGGPGSEEADGDRLAELFRQTLEELLAGEPAARAPRP